MKNVKDYTADELSAEIQSIKAECEKRADMLKCYEEELERRKQEVPLGVPSSNRIRTYYFVPEYRHTAFLSNEDEDDYLDKRFFEIMNYFSSKESAQKHLEMLLDWRKALVANSKGESIDITVLLPLLKKGWVVMGKDCRWFWCDDKPFKEMSCWGSRGYFKVLSLFNIRPVKHWEDSLMECGL